MSDFEEGNEEDEPPDADKADNYRKIKTYVLRSGRMTARQERDYNELKSHYTIPYGKTKMNFADLFSNTNPVVIEIGFGMGLATAEIARQNPELNFIGIEVHKPGVGRLLGEIRRLELRNLLIIEHDALEVIEDMVMDESVKGFNIFFPDPWQKKRHFKRRLVKRPNTDLFSQKLAPEGYIYMVSDWQPYAESALSELGETEGMVNKYEGFAPHQKWRVQTKFEKRGIEENREIFELFFEKRCRG